MLRIPELKQGQTPYDPETIDSVLNHDTPSVTGVPAYTVEEMLDHILIKDALTTLHQEDDGQFAKLAKADGADLRELVVNHDRFLKSQRDKFAAIFGNGKRRFFEAMSKGYFAESRRRAVSLQERLTGEYHQAVVERQNNELLDRALRPENVFDNAAQQRYRDMILYNVETAAADLPASDQKAALDAASHLFYKKVLDKRLELNPERLEPMLAADAIRRVFSDAELAVYEENTSAALLLKRCHAAARQWFDDGFSDAQAKTASHDEFPDKDAAAQALARFGHLHYMENRKKYLTSILNVSQVWKCLVDADFAVTAIPEWVNHSDPALLACVHELLARRLANGGAAPEPDFVRLCQFIDDFSPHATARNLAAEKTLHQLVVKLGGPDAPAFEAVLRVLLGKAEKKDWAWFADLRVAKKEWEKRGDGDCNEYLQRFDQARRLALKKNGEDELAFAEVMKICDGIL